MYVGWASLNLYRSAIQALGRTQEGAQGVDGLSAGGARRKCKMTEIHKQN
jgi:hypothetical protein